MPCNPSLKIDAGLSAHWFQLQRQDPKKKADEIAIELAVSEEQLISSRCGFYEENNTRLICEPIQILSELALLGEMTYVMENAVIKHEVDAVLTNIYGHKKTHSQANKPLFSPANVDVQFNFNQFKSIYAINDGGYLSLQFFDQHGQAMYRAFMTDNSSLKNYKSLIKYYKSHNQRPCGTRLEFCSSSKTKNGVDDLNKTPSKESFGNTVGYDDESIAISLSSGCIFSTSLGSSTIRELLEHLHKNKFSIKITVCNAAIQQAWSGVLKIKKVQGTCLRLFGKQFNLDIEASSIGHLWLVKKQSCTGEITTLEIYDKQKNYLATLEADTKENAYYESKKWEKLMSFLIRIEQCSSPSVFKKPIYK